MTIKNRLWDVLLACFVAGILAFGVVRARHELRWSAWAAGDAQNILASCHFNREGFLNHYFMLYLHPGYLGKSTGYESGVGYYTRYPPLSNMFNGAVMRIFGERLYPVRVAAVLFACLSLIFFYLTVSELFQKRIAFFATLFVGTTVGFLQFVDCLTCYTSSEFMRAAAMAVFLIAHRVQKERPALFRSLLGMVWLITFLESMNSFDYIIFLQLFYFLYYWLSDRERVSIPRLAFFASAPLLGQALHHFHNWYALSHFDLSAGAALMNGFAEKTMPFHRGLVKMATFVPYFFSHMQDYMVRSNFGFGFGTVFLMAMAAIFLRDKMNLEGPYADRGLSLGKILIIFGIPSISWWVFFSNHAATFFYTPMHVLPFVGLAFGLCIDAAFRCAWDCAQQKVIRCGAALVMAGCLIDPGIILYRYMRDYPNEIDPAKWVTLGSLEKLDKSTIAESVEVSRWIGSQTRYGDIVIAPKPFDDAVNLAEFYSMRRTDSYAGDSPEMVSSRIEELKRYREEGASKYKIFDPGLRLYALVDASDPTDASRAIVSRFQEAARMNERWILYSLDKI